VRSVAWQKQRARPKALTSSEIYASPAPTAHSNLACPLCERLAKNAVRTPCCRTTFCEECIQTHLLENDFVCRCGKKVASLDRLEADDKRRGEVGEVVMGMIEESRKESVSVCVNCLLSGPVYLTLTNGRQNKNLLKIHPPSRHPPTPRSSRPPPQTTNPLHHPIPPQTRLNKTSPRSRPSLRSSRKC
jgi:hypothetical protein